MSRLIIKIPRVGSVRFLLWFSLIITMLSETLISMDLIPDNQMTKIIQYFIILFPVGICLMIIFFHKNPISNRKNIFIGEFFSALLMVGILFIISLTLEIKANHFAFEPVMQCIQMLLPFLFTYLIMNYLSVEDINTFMKASFIFTLIGYFFCLDLSGVSFGDLLSISMITSYSPFESSTFAEVISGLTAYFIFTKDKNKKWFYLSFFLNFLAFKRVFVVQAVVLLISRILNKPDAQVKKKLIYLSILIWMVTIIGTYVLYQPSTATMIQDRFNINLAEFTVWRLFRLWYLVENDFVSWGLGSTSIFLNANVSGYLGAELEMDFIRLMYEVGILGVFCVVFTYLKITNRNKYCFWMINFCFLNLLMANGLIRYWGWTFRIITIAVANYTINNNKIKKSERYRLFRI